MRRFWMTCGAGIISFCLVLLLLSQSSALTPTNRKYKLNMGVNLEWMKLDPENGDDVDVDSFQAALGMGYFLTDMFEIGPEFSYKKFKEEVKNETKDVLAWSVAVKANAHFENESDIIPYLGIRIGAAKIDIRDDDDTAFTYGGQLGFDYFFTKGVSINPELRYTRTAFKLDEVDTDMDDVTLMISVAIHF